MNSTNKKLRTYHLDTPQHKLYTEMHKKQTLGFVNAKLQQYSALKKALTLLDGFVDQSDPELDIENSIHVYQTAEKIREKYPDDKELQIVGLIHDLGKVLYTYGEPGWCVVGDTYALGCQFPKSIVYYDSLQLSPEYGKYDYNHGNGIYNIGCGLGALTISYGHDEYLYQVLKGNRNHKLSQSYLDVIRYHSFYPWHTEGEYTQFMNSQDKVTLENVLKFNEFDLYSKLDDVVITDETKKYYDKLLDDFFHGEMMW